jgi:hypothetical protein
LQGTQVSEVGSQMGVALGHEEASTVQWVAPSLVVTSVELSTGAASEGASVAGASVTAASGTAASVGTPTHTPAVPHVPDWHNEAPASAVQGPSPLAYPHSLLLGSQTPLMHTTAPAATVHIPLRVGVCPATVGTPWPLASLGTHADIAVLQYWVDGHWLSRVQAAATQTEAVMLHMPDWHTVAPFIGVHGPSPLAYPHSLFVVSQTPETQTRVAAAAVQPPFSVGFVCVGSFGMAVPFVSFGLQAWVASSHQSPPEQSASTSQPPAGSHTPLVLHAPERQTVAPFIAVQGPSPLA